MSAAIGKAKALQGARSTLADLKLRDGRRFIDLGGAILPGAELTRTIDGASTITLPIYDPDKKLLREGLLSAKWDATLDGLPFRYLGASKQGKTLTLTLIDRNVARMQEHKGPKKGFRDPLTRAQFLKSLVNEACPGLPFYCPQLNVKQPIKKEKEGKAAKAKAETDRGKGIGDGAAGKVKGHKADSEQTDIVDRALRVAESLKAPMPARVALVAALIDESECRNTHSGTGTSVGVLQLQSEHGSVASRLDVEHCVTLFLTEGFTGGGSAIKLANAGKSPADIATTVQGNEAGASVYAPYVTEAREWVESFEGGDLSGEVEVEEPFVYEVKDDEDYWTAAKREAADVNWRFFLLPDRAMYLPETELIRAKVAAAIDDDTEGVEDFDFDFNVNKPITEGTLTALVAQWGFGPSRVITVEDYGPASLGTGKPPQKPRREGAQTGIGSNKLVDARTGEGKGRFLIETIETPLSEDAKAREATITCKRATPPLPEPAPETSSVSVSSDGGTTSGAGNATIERMLQAAEAEVAKDRPYAWGGGHSSFTGPYDCSGFVSFLLHVGGFLDTPEATTGLAAWGQAGAGDLVTVYVKTSGGSTEEHTMIEIAGNFFMSGGGENPNSNDGPCKFSPSATYKAEFNVKRHPKGF